jgi:general secretion pathway protein E
MLDMGCEPFLIASSLLGVLAQRLVRVLCPHCKTAYEPTDAELQTLGISRELAARGKICKAIGCNQCNQKGYIGRTVISELMVITDEVRQLILQRKDGGTIKKMAIEQHMKPLRIDGIRKVLQGTTTVEELLANTQTDE